MNDKQVRLLGYGTMLHRSSLGSTIGKSRSNDLDLVPVRVEGFKRLFNLRAEHYQPSFELSKRPIEVGAANIEPSARESLNALAFWANTEDIAGLDRRERYYRRVSVSVVDFSSGEPVGEGELYMSSTDAPWIIRDPQALLPRLEDVVYARRGAYSISREFGECYDATTYLADGKTRMIDIYASHLTGDLAVTKGENENFR